MECKDIQERLSAYLEGVVSPEEKVLIEQHLGSCAKCSSDLADLRKTIGLIKDIGEVEPPIWLTQRIMARVRSEAQPKKSPFQKLFYPLHVKLPVGAIATIAIALTTLYVFRTIQPEVRLAKAPSEEAVPQVSPKEEQRTLREAETDKSPSVSPSVTPPVLPLDRGRSEEGISQKRAEKGFSGERPAPAKPAEQPSVSKEMNVKVDKVTPSMAQEPEKKEEAKIPAPAERPAEMPAAGAVAKDGQRQEAGATAPKAKLSLMEKKDAGKLLSFTVLVRDPEAAGGELQKTVTKLGGRLLRTESAEEKSIITAEITAAKLRELVEKLKSVGQVEEKDIDFDAMTGEVGIRIEIVKNPRSD